MKKKLFNTVKTLLVLSLALFAAGCSKDNDEDKTTGSIIGKWLYEDVEVIEFKMKSNSVIPQEYLQSAIDEMKDDMAALWMYAGVLEFMADGRVKVQNSGYRIDSYTISGNKLTVKENDVDYVFRYKVTGNKLDLTMDIFEQTSAEMKEAMESLKLMGITAYKINLIFVSQGSTSNVKYTAAPDKNIKQGIIQILSKIVKINL